MWMDPLLYLTVTVMKAPSPLQTSLLMTQTLWFRNSWRIIFQTEITWRLKIHLKLSSQMVKKQMATVTYQITSLWRPLQKIRYFYYKAKILPVCFMRKNYVCHSLQKELKCEIVCMLLVWYRISTCFLLIPPFCIYDKSNPNSNCTFSLLAFLCLVQKKYIHFTSRFYWKISLNVNVLGEVLSATTTSHLDCNPNSTRDFFKLGRVAASIDLTVAM